MIRSQEKAREVGAMMAAQAQYTQGSPSGHGYDEGRRALLARVQHSGAHQGND